MTVKTEPEQASAPRQRTRKPASRYADVPTEYLLCLFRRQHMVPDDPNPQKIRLILDDYGRSVDLFEYVGTCMRCGIVRTQLKYQMDNRTWSNDYQPPEGYRPPAGEPYDRTELYAEYLRRFPPAAGRPQIRKAPGVK